MKKPVNLINPMLAVQQQSVAIWMAKPKSEQLEITMQVSSRNEFYPKLLELSIKSGD
jgi:hypothetical protein